MEFKTQVGIDEIDEQHKKLIEKMNELSKILSEEETIDEEYLEETMDFISSYSENHFKTEEKHMSKYNFPLLEYQKDEHEQFKLFTDNMIKRVKKEGYKDDMAEKINKYIIDWFMEHLRYEDLKFREHLKKKEENVSKEDIQ